MAGVNVALVMADLASLGCGGVLLWFAWLRETPEFWRNSGGYPLLLRDAVLVLFYPLLVVSVLTVAGLTLALCARFRRFGADVALRALLLLGCWSLLCGTVCVAFANNVDNLREDRPLHDKQRTGSR